MDNRRCWVCGELAYGEVVAIGKGTVNGTRYFPTTKVAIVHPACWLDLLDAVAVKPELKTLPWGG